MFNITIQIYLLFIPILVIILLLLNLFLSIKKPDYEKGTVYESGFNPILGQTRITFHILFFLIAILFLIFDLELLIFWAAALTLDFIINYGIIIALLFFVILTIGFIYEWNKGALYFIPSKYKKYYIK